MKRRLVHATGALPLALAVFAVLACSDGFPPQFPLPEFRLKSPVSGSVITREDLLGRPAMIYWFASW
jgi:hypothetical protein